MVVEYNGTNYYGSQWQTGLPTIQSEIEKALRGLTGETIRVAMASRTDAGVHAQRQVVSFLTGSALSRETFISGLNHYLPQDIAVKSTYIMDEFFEVRRIAMSRQYRYSILNVGTRSPLRESFAYRVVGTLDVDGMDQACQALVGEHDFASFASGIGGEEKSTVRRVYQAGVGRKGDFVVLDMVANAFVRHQVRSTAGCLVSIGLGKMSLDEFYSIIEVKQPGLAGPTLPACGLCLVRVNYPHPFEELNDDEDL
ncbi:MAG: tRNA pseudouridine(38-40) synthase TruA [Dehalococcoidales bacterium]|nr:MAG: tRNA pseudouridine(38-40) synthase TruA [Dehalococcoidales bacterium]